MMLTLVLGTTISFSSCGSGDDDVTGGDGQTTSKAPKGAEAVDLGLSVKWANMNIGAISPEGYGDYFAWGETTPKNTYDWSTYNWCKGSYNNITKYCTNSSYGTVDDKVTLELADDAAHANWGGSWRMPTIAELNELRIKCKWQWTYMNGKKGYVVTGPNGNFIFLPAAGYHGKESLGMVGLSGIYLPSSLDASSMINAYHLGFGEGFVSTSHGNRCDGLSVRAVCP